MTANPYFSALRLDQFRSYPSLDVRFDARPVVLFGDNGAGKTNLLEALSLLAPGRGLRGAKPDALAHIDQGVPADHWAVSVDMVNVDYEKAGIGVMPGIPGRRIVRLDGQTATSTALARALRIGWLTPAQDRLFVDGASGRRKFLDRLCLAQTPDHGSNMIAYEKSRAERRRLFTDGINDPYWFDALESDMAQRGAKIALARIQTLNALKRAIVQRPDGAFPKADLAIMGEAEALAQQGADDMQIYEFIKDGLHADRALDARAGRTLRGVHKSDLHVTHREKSMPAGDCSTGEQKALLSGIVLAHATAQCALGVDTTPILLLDEVAAHLDQQRRAALSAEILDLGLQCFLTGTDKSLFSAFEGDAQFFHVTDGNLHPL